jgi:hypothetical protein
MAKNDHVKCRNKPGTICEIFCERCGAAEDITGSLRVEEFNRIIDKFILQHKNCTKKEEKINE